MIEAEMPSHPGYFQKQWAPRNITGSLDRYVKARDQIWQIALSALPFLGGFGLYKGKSKALSNIMADRYHCTNIHLVILTLMFQNFYYTQKWYSWQSDFQLCTSHWFSYQSDFQLCTSHWYSYQSDFHLCTSHCYSCQSDFQLCTHHWYSCQSDFQLCTSHWYSCQSDFQLCTSHWQGCRKPPTLRICPQAEIYDPH